MNGRMGAVAGADVRKTRNQEPIDWRRILERIIETLLIAAVISLVGIVINMHTEVRILQDRLNGSAHESRSEGGQGASQQPTNGGSNPGSGHDSVKPEELCPIIERQQRTHVKESFGEWASESFTEDDLRRFQEQDIPRHIYLRGPGDPGVATKQAPVVAGSVHKTTASHLGTTRENQSRGPN